MLGNDFVSSLSQAELNVFNYFQKINREQKLFDEVGQYLTNSDQVMFKKFSGKSKIYGFDILNRDDSIKVKLTYAVGYFYSVDLSIPKEIFDQFAQKGSVIEAPQRSRYSLNKQEKTLVAQEENVEIEYFTLKK